MVMRADAQKHEGKKIGKEKKKKKRARLWQPMMMSGEERPITRSGCLDTYSKRNEFTCHRYCTCPVHSSNLDRTAPQDLWSVLSPAKPQSKGH